jgi:hypothetical protein
MDIPPVTAPPENMIRSSNVHVTPVPGVVYPRAFCVTWGNTASIPAAIIATTIIDNPFLLFVPELDMHCFCTNSLPLYKSESI